MMREKVLYKYTLRDSLPPSPISIHHRVGFQFFIPSESQIRSFGCLQSFPSNQIGIPGGVLLCCSVLPAEFAFLSLLLASDFLSFFQVCGAVGGGWDL